MIFLERVARYRHWIGYAVLAVGWIGIKLQDPVATLVTFTLVLGVLIAGGLAFANGVFDKEQLAFSASDKLLIAAGFGVYLVGIYNQHDANGSTTPLMFASLLNFNLVMIGSSHSAEKGS